MHLGYFGGKEEASAAYQKALAAKKLAEQAKAEAEEKIHARIQLQRDRMRTELRSRLRPLQQSNG